MPLSLTFTEGGLPQGSEKEAGKRITAAFLKWHGLSGNKVMPPNVTNHINVLPEDHTLSGGEPFVEPGRNLEHGRPGDDQCANGRSCIKRLSRNTRKASVSTKFKMEIAMFKKACFAIIVSATVAGASTSMAQENEASCVPIGGVAIPNFFSEGEGKPIIISAALTGSVNNAAGKITAQRTTPTGLEMDMEHYFGTEDGGAFQTKDLGVLTAVPGKPGRFMIEIAYHIQEDVTRGTLKGVKGQFNSYGLVDLRDPDNMVGLVRYNGEVCK